MQAEQAAKQEKTATTSTATATKSTTSATKASSLDPCDQPGMTPLQKKRCRMSK
jgi:hypothetical protein